MRELFRGYYQPTTEEVTKIWDDGLTVLDANVLLSLYKVLPATSTLYLDAMEKRAEKNWLPYQVAFEFHKNVHKIRSEQTAGHSKRIRDVEAFSNILRKTENKSRLQESDLQLQIQNLLAKFLDELKNEQSGIKDQTHYQKPDDLLGRISDLFLGKVGPRPSGEELAAMHVQGKSRFDSETPPGYEDKKTKSGGDEYGDYIFWQQVMDHAKAEKVDVVLVTDDNKGDWWLKIDGDSVAPRPELVQEFRDSTGQDIIIWPSGKFYSHLMSETEGDGKSAEVQAAADDMQETVTWSQESKDRFIRDEWLRRADLNRLFDFYVDHESSQLGNVHGAHNADKSDLQRSGISLQSLLSGDVSLEPGMLSRENLDVLVEELERLTVFSLNLRKKATKIRESIASTPPESDLNHKLWRELQGVAASLDETEIQMTKLRHMIAMEG